MKHPETLSVDEFKGTSGEWNTEKGRWNVNMVQCSIPDGGTVCIIDILPRVTAEYLKDYFRQYSADQRKRVKYFCCDMHKGFISVAK